MNAITAGPNTSARLNLEDEHIKGVVRRGGGDDVHAGGTVAGLGLGADATLDAPSGRPEISFSSVRGRGVKLPPRVRVFTTETGELDYELSGPVKIGPVKVADEGVYVIGTPDPRKPKPQPKPRQTPR